MRRFVEALEWLFRHAIVYPILRLVFHNQYSDQPIRLENVRRLIILRFDRIGDMIVTTPIVKALKTRHPSLLIGVFTSQANAEILRHNPYVDDIYVLHRNWWRMGKEILRAREAEYDVALNFIFNRTTSAGILANVAAPQACKVGQGDPKYRFFFNRLLRLERSTSHMVEVLAGYVETVFGIRIEREELRFQIGIDEETRISVDQFLATAGLRRRDSNKGRSQFYLVVNISTTEAVRALSYEQSLHLVRHLVTRSSYAVVVISSPTMRRTVDSILYEINSDRCTPFPKKGAASLLQIASLIHGAVAILTPDTSIIHFASAMDTPVLGFFTPLQQTHEWMPYNVHHATVFAPEGKPVSEIPVQELCRAADHFLQSVSPG